MKIKKIDGTSIFMIALTLLGIVAIFVGLIEGMNTQEEYGTSIIAEGIVEDFNTYEKKNLLRTDIGYEIKIDGKWIEVSKEGYYKANLGDYVVIYGFGNIEVIEQ